MSTAETLTYPPTLDADTVARLYDVSKRFAYEQARRYIETNGAEGIPAIRCGHRAVKFLTGPILEQLGLHGSIRLEIAQ